MYFRAYAMYFRAYAMYFACTRVVFSRECNVAYVAYARVCNVPSLLVHGARMQRRGPYMSKSTRHFLCADFANISNPPLSFLDCITACTPGRECTGAARSVVGSSTPPFPTALRAFVFFLSPHSNSTLCQFRGGGCPYNKLKPRDDG